jgi:hypothetical protein
MKAIALIFGVLAAMSVTLKAQNVNNPCVASTGPWYLGTCPQVTNSPSLSPDTLCGHVGESPCKPTVVPPSYDVGVKHRGITHTDCSSTTETAPITYSVSDVQWDPVLPTAWTDSHKPNFQSTAYVIVSSADPLCPSPGRIDIGTVTWNVVNTNRELFMTISPGAAVQFLLGVIGTINSATKVVGCQATNPSMSGTITLYRSHMCCSCTSGPYMRSSAEGQISASWREIDCPIPGASIQVPGGFAGVGLYVTAGFSGSAQMKRGVAQPCVVEPVCMTLAATGHFGLKAQGYISLPAGWRAASRLVGQQAQVLQQPHRMQTDFAGLKDILAGLRPKLKRSSKRWAAPSSVRFSKPHISFGMEFLSDRMRQAAFAIKRKAN